MFLSLDAQLTSFNLVQKKYSTQKSTTKKSKKKREIV